MSDVVRRVIRSRCTRVVRGAEGGGSAERLRARGEGCTRCQESVLVALISCAFAANMSGSKFQTFQRVSRFVVARFRSAGINDLVHPLSRILRLKERLPDINPVNKRRLRQIRETAYFPQSAPDSCRGCSPPPSHPAWNGPPRAVKRSPVEYFARATPPPEQTEQDDQIFEE